MSGEISGNWDAVVNDTIPVRTAPNPQAAAKNDNWDAVQDEGANSDPWGAINDSSSDLVEYQRLLKICGYSGYNIFQDLLDFANKHIWEIDKEYTPADERMILKGPTTQKLAEQHKQCERIIWSALAGQENKDKFLEVLCTLLSVGEKDFSSDSIAEAVEYTRTLLSKPDMIDELGEKLDAYYKALKKGKFNNGSEETSAAFWATLATERKDKYAGEGIDRRVMIKVIEDAQTAFSPKTKEVLNNVAESITKSNCTTPLTIDRKAQEEDIKEWKGKAELEQALDRSYIFGVKLGIKSKQRPFSDIKTAALTPSDIREAANVYGRKWRTRTFLQRSEQVALSNAAKKKDLNDDQRKALQILTTNDGLSDKDIDILKSLSGTVPLINKALGQLEIVKDGLDADGVKTLDDLANELEGGKYKDHEGLCIVAEDGTYCLACLDESGRFFKTPDKTYSDGVKLLSRIGWQIWENVSTYEEDKGFWEMLASAPAEVVKGIQAATARQSVKINDSISPIVMTIKMVATPKKAEALIAKLDEYDQINAKYDELYAQGKTEECLKLINERERLADELQEASMDAGGDSIDLDLWQAMKVRFTDAIKAADGIPLADQDSSEINFKKAPLTLDDGTVVRSRVELIDHVLGKSKKWATISLTPGEDRDVTRAKKALATIFASIRSVNKDTINLPALFFALPVGGLTQVAFTVVGAAFRAINIGSVDIGAKNTKEFLAAQQSRAWGRMFNKFLDNISAYQYQGGGPMNVSLYMHMLIIRDADRPDRELANILTQADKLAGLNYLTLDDVKKSIKAFQDLEERVNLLAAQTPGLIDKIKKAIKGKENKAISFTSDGKLHFNLEPVEKMVNDWKSGKQLELLDLYHARNKEEEYLCAAMMSAFKMEDILAGSEDPGNLSSPVTGADLYDEWKGLKGEKEKIPAIITYTGGAYDHYNPTAFLEEMKDAGGYFFNKAFNNKDRSKINILKDRFSVAGRIIRAGAGTTLLFAGMPYMFGLTFVDMAADLMRGDYQSAEKKFCQLTGAVLAYGFLPTAWWSMIKERLDAKDYEGAVGVAAAITAFSIYVAYRDVRMVENFARFFMGRDTVKFDVSPFEWPIYKLLGLAGKAFNKFVVPQEKRYKEWGGEKWETEIGPAFDKWMFDQPVVRSVYNLINLIKGDNFDLDELLAQSSPEVQEGKAMKSLVMFVGDEVIQQKLSSYLWAVLSFKADKGVKWGKQWVKSKLGKNKNVDWKAVNKQAFDFYGDKIVFIDDHNEVMKKDKVAEIFENIKGAFEGRIAGLTSEEVSKYMPAVEDEVLDQICAQIKDEIDEVAKSMKAQDPQLSDEAISKKIRADLKARFKDQILESLKGAVLEGKNKASLNSALPNLEKLKEHMGIDIDSKFAELEGSIENSIAEIKKIKTEKGDEKAKSKTIELATKTYEPAIRKLIEKMGGKEAWANEGTKWLKLLDGINDGDHLMALLDFVQDMRLQIKDTKTPAGLEVLMQEFAIEERKALNEVAKMVREGQSAAEIDKKIHELTSKYFKEKMGLIAKKIQNRTRRIVVSPKVHRIVQDIAGEYNVDSLRTQVELDDSGQMIFKGGKFKEFNEMQPVVRELAIDPTGKPKAVQAKVNQEIMDSSIGYMELVNLPPAENPDLAKQFPDYKLLNYEVVLPQEGAPISRVKVKIVIYPEFFKKTPEEQKELFNKLQEFIGTNNVDLSGLPPKPMAIYPVIEKLRGAGIAIEDAKIQETLKESMSEETAIRFMDYLKEKKINRLDEENWEAVRAGFFEKEMARLAQTTEKPVQGEIKPMPKEIVDYANRVLEKVKTDEAEAGKIKLTFEQANAALKDRWTDLSQKINEFRSKGQPIPEGTQIEFDALVSEVIELYSKFGLIPEENKVISLRDYQIQAAKLLSDEVKNGENKIGLKIPTGKGKTYVGLLTILREQCLWNNDVTITTMQEFLARTMANQYKPILKFFGKEVACIDSSLEADSPEKLAAYKADVKVMTDTQWAFDAEHDMLQCDNRKMYQKKVPDVVIHDEVHIGDQEHYIISGIGQGSPEIYMKARAKAKRLIEKEDFTIDERAKKAYFTEKGEEKLGPCSPEMRHQILEAFLAWKCYKKDVEIAIDKETGEVHIIERGSISKDKRFGDGLHEQIELENGKDPKGPNRTELSLTREQLHQFDLDRGTKKIVGYSGTPDNVDDFDKYETTLKEDQTRDIKDPLLFKNQNAQFNWDLEICRQNPKASVLIYFQDAPTAEEFISFGEKNGLACKAISHIQVGVDATGAKQYECVKAAIDRAKQPGSITAATELIATGANIKNVTVEVINFQTDRVTKKQIEGRVGADRLPEGVEKAIIYQSYVLETDGLIKMHCPDAFREFMQKFGFADKEVIKPGDPGYQEVKEWLFKIQIQAENTAKARKQAESYRSMGSDYPHFYANNVGSFGGLAERIRNADATDPTKTIEVIVEAVSRLKGIKDEAEIKAIKEKISDSIKKAGIEINVKELKRVLIQEVINESRTKYMSGEEKLQNSADLTAGPNSEGYFRSQQELFIKAYIATLDKAMNKIVRLDPRLVKIINSELMPQTEQTKEPVVPVKPQAPKNYLKMFEDAGIKVIYLNGALKDATEAEVIQLIEGLKVSGVKVVSFAKGVTLDGNISSLIESLPAGGNQKIFVFSPNGGSGPKIEKIDLGDWQYEPGDGAGEHILRRNGKVEKFTTFKDLVKWAKNERSTAGNMINNEKGVVALGAVERELPEGITTTVMEINFQPADGKSDPKPPAVPQNPGLIGTALPFAIANSMFSFGKQIFNLANGKGFDGIQVGLDTGSGAWGGFKFYVMLSAAENFWKYTPGMATNFAWGYPAIQGLGSIPEEARPKYVTQQALGFGEFVGGMSLTQCFLGSKPFFSNPESTFLGLPGTAWGGSLGLLGGIAISYGGSMAFDYVYNKNILNTQTVLNSSQGRAVVNGVTELGFKPLGSYWGVNFYSTMTSLGLKQLENYAITRTGTSLGLDSLAAECGSKLVGLVPAVVTAVCDGSQGIIDAIYGVTYFDKNVRGEAAKLAKKDAYQMNVLFKGFDTSSWDELFMSVGACTWTGFYQIAEFLGRTWVDDKWDWATKGAYRDTACENIFIENYRFNRALTLSWNGLKVTLESLQKALPRTADLDKVQKLFNDAVNNVVVNDNGSEQKAYAAYQKLIKMIGTGNFDKVIDEVRFEASENGYRENGLFTRALTLSMNGYKITRELLQKTLPKDAKLDKVLELFNSAVNNVNVKDKASMKNAAAEYLKLIKMIGIDNFEKVINEYCVGPLSKLREFGAVDAKVRADLRAKTLKQMGHEYDVAYNTYLIKQLSDADQLKIKISPSDYPNEFSRKSSYSAVRQWVKGLKEIEKYGVVSLIAGTDVKINEENIGRILKALGTAQGYYFLHKGDIKEVIINKGEIIVNYFVNGRIWGAKIEITPSGSGKPRAVKVDKKTKDRIAGLDKSVKDAITRQDGSQEITYQNAYFTYPISTATPVVKKRIV